MTFMPEAETTFLLRRAEQESILAIKAGESLASAAHYVMALRYSVRARAALSRLKLLGQP
jgi:hypothetical protein